MTSVANAHSSLLEKSERDELNQHQNHQNHQSHSQDHHDVETPDVFQEEEAESAPYYSWRIADFGSIGARSRDGSKFE